MHLLEVLWIPLFRFKPIQRVWAILLIGTNCGALLFVQSNYAQIAILAAVAGAITMMVIYASHGFVRLLGIGHIFWIPMLPYFVTHMPDPTSNPSLYMWMTVLIATNCISLVIDAIDLTRFFRGEREPHYYWREDFAL